MAETIERILPDVDWLPTHQVTTVDELRAIVGVPKATTATKETPYLTPLLAEFIAASPYFMLATAAADGKCDVSPRGDPAGSVAVLNPRTIAFGDRLGNRRIESLQNMISNPHAGLLFLVPGTDEILRVNGRVTLTRDPELMRRLAMNGREPNVVIVLHIEAAYTHCARSILRSKLWDPEMWPDPDTIPTLADMMAEQHQLEAPDPSEGKRNEEYRKTLY